MSEGVVRGPHDDPSLTDEELLAQRRAWFDAYTRTRNVFAPVADDPYTCPCCGHRTLPRRGSYDLCSECGWEDDGQDEHDSRETRGGPNGTFSLDDARAMYEAEGGVRQPHVAPVEPK